MIIVNVSALKCIMVHFWKKSILLPLPLFQPDTTMFFMAHIIQQAIVF